jgi:signal peptidase II
MQRSSYSAYALSKSSVQVRLFSRLTRILRYKWLLSLSAAVFLLDQGTKAWILHNLPLGTYFPPEAIVVIPDFFHIVHLGNTGAAWGILEGMSLWLALLATIAIAAIFMFRRYLNLELLPVQVSFGLLMGGILGNLVDRALHGYVVDFLDFRFGAFTWPSFNVADAGICIGVGIYLTLSFLRPALLEKQDQAPPPTT